jgi:predicted nucleotide-binding protein
MSVSLAEQQASRQPASGLQLRSAMPVVDEFRKYLKRRGVTFQEKRSSTGTEFECADGEVFTLHGSGHMTVSQTPTRLNKAVGAMTISPMDSTDVTDLARFLWDQRKPIQVSSTDRRVFIVHGHDVPARKELELLLRQLRMEPIVLMALPAQGETIIEKLEHYLVEHDNVGFACVLLTPDDEGHRVGKADEKRFRARQNVVLELGMVMGRMGRGRVAILHKGSVELPSDIGGLVYHSFKESVDEVKTQLFQDLRNAGFDPDPDGL